MLEKTIILDGFSKTYAMTGWRMGYGVMPPFLVDPVNKLMVNSNSCTASFTQRAGIAALCGPQDKVTEMVAEFHRRRDAFCAGLNSIPGWRCAIPGGAFYAFFSVKAHFGRPLGGRKVTDSAGFCQAALEAAHVNVVPGSAFGAEGYVRLSFAASREQLNGGLDQLEHLLARAS